MPHPFDLTLYLVTDPRQVAARGLAATVEQAVRGGATLVQLRDPDAHGRELVAQARALKALLEPLGIALIVNDRVDVAHAAGADGVHLGQDDLPLADARRLAGDRLVIGISTHDVAEARAAQDGGADYVGFGPMFPTATKADAYPQRTFDELARVRAAITIPIVAIGGISEATAPSVLAAGADAVAMIGALAASDDPRTLVRRLLARTP